jgi:hypothetical protein
LIFREQAIGLSFLILFLLSSCISQTTRLGQDQAVDIAWKTLRPNTTSGKSDNWQVSEARRVAGRDVVNQFTDARFTNCPGPMPPENKAIKASSEYWYIKIVPAPATPIPQATAAGGPPAVPEPFIQEVLVLIDVFNGQVTARKFTCLAY